MESKFDVLMCSTANIKSTAGQARRMTDKKRMSGRGWQRMTNMAGQLDRQRKGLKEMGRKRQVEIRSDRERVEK